MDWIYLTNEATGGATKVPNEPGVKEWHEARGWVVSEEPTEDIFVPAPGDNSPEHTEWVTLYHPAVDATHEFPNNPAAIEGAIEAGWEKPVPPQADEDSPPGETPATETPEPEPASKTSKRRASASADTEKVND
jgi:hypothetical protein